MIQEMKMYSAYARGPMPGEAKKSKKNRGATSASVTTRQLASFAGSKSSRSSKQNHRRSSGFVKSLEEPQAASQSRVGFVLPSRNDPSAAAALADFSNFFPNASTIAVPQQNSQNAPLSQLTLSQDVESLRGLGFGGPSGSNARNTPTFGQPSLSSSGGTLDLSKFFR